MAKKQAKQGRGPRTRIRGVRSAPRKPSAAATEAAAALSVRHDASADEAAAGLAPVTVVGVGMSAGGLEACSQMLEALPRHPGLALVLIQHLAPHQHSSLPALLAQHSAVPVVEAANEMIVEADHVYVIPPDVVMELGAGGLRLTPRPTAPSQTHPVDSFFTSLASIKGDGAVGVILSGTGSDGVNGLRNIKERGGTIIVQQPATAKYDGMPRAAVDTGMVDLVLPPAEIGRKLTELARGSYATSPAQQEPEISEQQFEELAALLRHASGVDFSHYKQPTMRRRIVRRMSMQRFADVGRYIDWVRQHPEEARNLYQDILIHVTRFFREPASFDELAATVLSKLLPGRRPDNPLRIWVAGCSTGEEAYSAAIVVFEAAAEAGVEPNLQLFGTDVSEAAVDYARQGVYPPSIAEDVSADRLRRFFTKNGGGFRISKSIRDRCIFARQDLTRDPPFSRLDLIICRNVLIYMDASLQRKVMGVFHYALNPNGYLMLGQAETTGSQAEFFTLVEKKHRVYRKRSVEHMALAAPLTYPVHAPRGGSHASGHEKFAGDLRTVHTEASRTLLERYGPPGVLINNDMEILQFRGRTGPYLEPAPGDASLNLLKLAREGLLHGVRSAVLAARKSRKPVRKDGLRVKSNGDWLEVDLEVIPLVSLPVLHFLVTFIEPQRAKAKGDARPPKTAVRPAKDGPRVERLEEELSSTRQYLQSIIQEVEAANEELQSANEEILSSNEELQSTNEELDTAKEELQSTNEELNTLNEELHARNEELSQVNNDLVNLLGSVQIAIVIVSNDLRIRRFTPMAEKMLNLIASDVGRPITQVKPNIEVPDLGDLIAEVLDKVEPREREVKDVDGRWHTLRIRPYKGLENRIDGAVLALFDIDSAKRHEMYVERMRQVIDSVATVVAQPLGVIDRALRVRSVNRAFCEAFRVDSAAVVGRLMYEVIPNGLAELRSMLETVARENRPVEGCELRQHADGGTMTVNAWPIETSEFGDGSILVAFRRETGQAA